MFPNGLDKLLQTSENKRRAAHCLFRWQRDNNFPLYRKDRIALFIRVAILKYIHDVACKEYPVAV